MSWGDGPLVGSRARAETRPSAGKTVLPGRVGADGTAAAAAALTRPVCQLLAARRRRRPLQPAGPRARRPLAPRPHRRAPGAPAAGIPKFYRWLSERYPLLNMSVAATEAPPEMDNLYLDMNGIIHNCTHANDPNLKLTEAEMVVRIFTYLDKLIQIIKPQRLVFMAIDGARARRSGRAAARRPGRGPDGVRAGGYGEEQAGGWGRVHREAVGRRACGIFPPRDAPTSRPAPAFPRPAQASRRAPR